MPYWLDVSGTTMKNQFIKKGFTLIEILITVSIIGLLASLTLVSFGGSQKATRDTQRKSDLKQYASALENYANQNSSLYPERSTTVSAKNTLCTDLAITTCPEDPKKQADSSFFYRYQSNGTDGGTDATVYVLWDKLESTSDYWVVCSAGKIGAKAQSLWSNPSAGACPL